MPVIYSDKRLLSWASIIEDDTLEQARRTASMPFIYPHLALMPDAHLGKGATVGSVIPTDGAVIPAAVGVDIGCGMNAVRTQWTVDDVAGRDLKGFREQVEATIPLSAGKYNDGLTDSAAQRAARLDDLGVKAGLYADRYAGNWREQIGTLGSGNHFLELTADQEDRVWLFLHSGSRGVGNKIAQHHIKVAADYCKKHWINLPDPDLAYLVQGTREFDRYMAELAWAQQFAAANRAEMMDRLTAALEATMGATVEPGLDVSCHHNYTARERHYGKNLIVSRKGAIDAHEGTWGLIPGSMGDKSYVVLGKGNRQSLCSAPHGAGRALSRTKARATFTHDDLVDRMAGIEWSGSKAFLDEHPAAYKDIDVVMADAADLVEVRYTLRQLVNVKGD